MRPIFFKESLNEDAAEMRQYLPVNVNTDFEVLSPALADAETKYITPILGTDLTSTLKDYYDSASQTDPVKDNIIQRIQSATIRIAYYESFDLLSINITDSGLQDINEDKRVYRYQADRAKDTLASQAFEHLQYFYDALVASNLRTWEDDDPTNPRPKDSVFASYAEFFRATRLSEDFRLFGKLTPWIRSAEQTVLPYNIGSTLTKAIISKESRITADMRSLAQRIVAFYALSQACNILQGYLTADGLVVRSMRVDGSSGGYQSSTADSSTRAQLAKTYAAISESAAVELTALFRADTSTFPEISLVSSRDNIRTHIPSHNKKSFRV